MSSIWSCCRTVGHNDPRIIQINHYVLSVFPRYRQNISVFHAMEIKIELSSITFSIPSCPQIRIVCMTSKLIPSFWLFLKLFKVFTNAGLILIIFHHRYCQPQEIHPRYVKGVRCFCLRCKVVLRSMSICLKIFMFSYITSCSIFTLSWNTLCISASYWLPILNTM